MKRPARPPADAKTGTLFTAAAFELDAAADPAEVLVPWELEVAVPVRRT